MWINWLESHSALGHPLINRNIAVTISVLKENRNPTFTSTQSHSSEDHILDNDLRDDHLTFIIKEIYYSVLQMNSIKLSTVWIAFNEETSR